MLWIIWIPVAKKLCSAKRKATRCSYVITSKHRIATLIIYATAVLEGLSIQLENFDGARRSQRTSKVYCFSVITRWKLGFM